MPPEIDTRFTNRVALVTGGSRGIGYAITEQLLARGARVAITGLDQGNLETAAHQLDVGDRLLTIQADAGDLDTIGATVAGVVHTLGPLDLLVNNAATTGEGSLADITPQFAMKVLRTNTVAPLLYSQHAHRLSMALSGGAIVNVVSMAAFRYPTALPWYSVSKAALVRQTEVMAAEFGPAVRVNAVSPATTLTPRAAPYLVDGKAAELALEYPLRRLGQSEEVAKATLFLLSDEASFITGATLIVDGGSTTYSSGTFC